MPWKIWRVLLFIIHNTRSYLNIIAGAARLCRVWRGHPKLKSFNTEMKYQSSFWKLTLMQKTEWIAAFPLFSEGQYNEPNAKHNRTLPCSAMTNTACVIQELSLWNEGTIFSGCVPCNVCKTLGRELLSHSTAQWIYFTYHGYFGLLYANRKSRKWGWEVAKGLDGRSGGAHKVVLMTVKHIYFSNTTASVHGHPMESFQVKKTGLIYAGTPSKETDGSLTHWDMFTSHITSQILQHRAFVISLPCHTLGSFASINAVLRVPLKPSCTVCKLSIINFDLQLIYRVSGRCFHITYPSPCNRRCWGLNLESSASCMSSRYSIIESWFFSLGLSGTECHISCRGLQWVEGLGKKFPPFFFCKQHDPAGAIQPSEVAFSHGQKWVNFQS